MVRLEYLPTQTNELGSLGSLADRDRGSLKTLLLMREILTLGQTERKTGQLPMQSNRKMGCEQISIELIAFLRM